MLRRKITVLSAILLFTTGLGFGMAIGYKYAKNQLPAQQTTIEIKDLNAKKGGVISIDAESDQQQDNKKDESKKKGFFNKLFN
ncbi:MULTISPECIES: hypothetical protein [Marinifilum]|uniref:Uncharacterized protein n=1 Tax=Marinifilum caeruleilacunae TaxID=2499076 RepID=A0ABX1WT17_9BACT|nr:MULTISPECIES: hypothetical protein [Marinifilum]MDQ2178824.1 hypothetical protein [Marinifilum sp. D714]NOU59090.1 hypothetical protein [Marinifilum caeruleilacunae]